MKHIHEPRLGHTLTSDYSTWAWLVSWTSHIETDLVRVDRMHSWVAFRLGSGVSGPEIHCWADDSYWALGMIGLHGLDDYYVMLHEYMGFDICNLVCVVPST
ncbi:hypothetical protein HanRHA438_Chr02g0066211 [Helianthus annuus]|nr:hypothetical protein HanRHA438_Chr02g0066211 [Helianthus annuus]